MIIRDLYGKQMLAMAWWNLPEYQKIDGILCDGAVRSGKTMALTCGFFLWSMSNFNNQVFALCGKTVGALRRNLLMPMRQWLKGLCYITEHRGENKLNVRVGGRKNTYYLFGGQDESSYTLIQGITLAGALLDEVVLMPRSFVEQAAARCSVEGAKLWFSCNPESQEHWFYREWVEKTEEKRILRLHFTMEDNPALTEAVRQRYQRLYSGVFYRRYVLGQWCAAQGQIYEFDRQRHVLSREAVAAWLRGEDLPTENDGLGDGFLHSLRSVEMTEGDGFLHSLRSVEMTEGGAGGRLPPRHGASGKWYISVDYGTRNPFSAGLWCLREGTAVRVAEYYHDGRSTGITKTDEEYYEALTQLAGTLPVERIIIDPSAASLIALIRRRGQFRVRRADNRVLPGIRLVGSLLQQGQVRICEDCKDTIREFSLYCWQDDDARDVPKKENDHAMDDVRYFCMSIMARQLTVDS